MKYLPITAVLALFTHSAFALDVRVELEKLPNYSTKFICAFVQNVDVASVSGILSFYVSGMKAKKDIQIKLLSSGEEKSVCISFADNEVLDSRIAVATVEFKDQKNSILDSDSKIFSTDKPRINKPSVVSSQNISNGAKSVVKRISTITTCMRHEECDAGSIDSLDFECVGEKISSISKMIEEKIPDSKYLVDSLKFQCSGEVSLCSGTTFVDARCVVENLKFVVGELNHF